jgi:hypothetical protein
MFLRVIFANEIAFHLTRSERKLGCPLDALTPPPAVSSGVAALPIGRRSANAAITALLFSRSAVASLEVRLGATALIRTPREPYSSAKARVKFVMAPFAAV